MRVIILFGTESGNSELVADEVAESLREAETDGGDAPQVDVVDMADAEIECFDPDALHLIICSTHGEGELPSGAEPFASTLDEIQPDLTGVKYAIFGLGDSSYDVYSRGSELIDERLAALGAARVGEYGRHDASSRDLPSDLAIAWANDTLALLERTSA